MLPNCAAEAGSVQAVGQVKSEHIFAAVILQLRHELTVTAGVLSICALTYTS